MMHIHNPKYFFIFLCILGANTVSFSSENDKYYQMQWERDKLRIMQEIIPGTLVPDEPEYGDEGGYTPLCYAIARNDFRFVASLLKDGANPNKEIYNASSSRPIFCAVSLEMVTYLQNNGADIHADNQGSFYSGMNFMHKAINCNTEDDRLFEYALTQGFNPKTLNGKGGNLWHSLIHILVCACPEETLMKRAKLLHSLGIDPDHRDNQERSAIDILNDQISDETAFLTREAGVRRFELGDRIEIRDKLQRFLDFIKTGSSATKK